MSSSHEKVITMESLNPHVTKMEYAVRGPLLIRALAIEKEITEGKQKPFKNVIKANLGDAHAMGQTPITFIREVVACVANPALIESGKFASDVVEHAETILKNCGGYSAGAYSQSPGIDIIRKHIADYISRRDSGIPCDFENVFLSSGATDSIRNVLKLFVTNSSNKKTGVMVPIPQYPLYSAAIEEFGLGQVGYYLDEENDWEFGVEQLESAFEKGSKDYNIRALVIINPGNPTGHILSEGSITQIVRFAQKHRLFLLADEVYQDNVYDEKCAFHSFKKVMFCMGEPFSKMELASFHSASKGYMGECGMRAGYVELVNLDAEVFLMYKKMISAKLCASILGQTVMDCVVNPPKPGEPSYDCWLAEKTAVLKSLKERAKLVHEAFESIEGIECNAIKGAMYAFPRIIMPQKAIEKAKTMNKPADFYYAMQLLESTGICIVPGSGFGQKENTYHFRTTILPQPDLMKDMLERFKGFHTKFMKEHQ